jgi:hypothetical protein
MIPDNMIPLLTGPFSALILAITLLAVIYKLIVDHVAPAIKNYFDRHLEQVDRMIEEHRLDREAWQSSMIILDGKLTAISEDVKELKKVNLQQ